VFLIGFFDFSLFIEIFFCRANFLPFPGFFFYHFYSKKIKIPKTPSQTPSQNLPNFFSRPPLARETPIFWGDACFFAGGFWLDFPTRGPNDWGAFLMIIFVLAGKGPIKPFKLDICFLKKQVFFFFSPQLFRGKNGGN